MAELERLQQASWPPLLHAVVRYANAVVHRWEGRYAEARREFEESRALYLQGGAHIRAARCLLNAAGAAVLAGCADAALVASRQAADELAGVHDPSWHLEALAGIFTALLVKGDAAAAHDPFVRAVPLILRYDLGFHYGHRAALLASLEGHAEQAARLIGYGDAGKDGARAPRAGTHRDHDPRTGDRILAFAGAGLVARRALDARRCNARRPRRLCTPYRRIGVARSHRLGGDRSLSH